MKNFIVIIFCQYQNQDLFCLNFLLSCKFYFAVKLYIFLRNLFYSQIFYLLGAYVIYVVTPGVVQEEDVAFLSRGFNLFWGDKFNAYHRIFNANCALSHSKILSFLLYSTLVREPSPLVGQIWVPLLHHSLFIFSQEKDTYKQNRRDQL